MTKKKKTQLIKNTDGSWTYKVNPFSDENALSTEETAAAIEEDRNESKPPVTALVKKNSKAVFMKRNRSIWKAVLIAGISAILIGSLMGFFVFRLLVQVNTPTSAGSQPVNQFPAGTDQEEQAAENTDLPTVTASMDSIDMYILQTGVFAEKENADLLIEELAAAGIQTALIEREGQFILIAGAGPSKEAAQSIAAGISDNQEDIYVKEWKTEAKEIEVTEAENDWLMTFQDFFQQQLLTASQTEPVPEAEIQELIEKAPKDGMVVNELVAGLDKTLDQPSTFQLVSWIKLWEEL